MEKSSVEMTDLIIEDIWGTTKLTKATIEETEERILIHSSFQGGGEMSIPKSQVVEISGYYLPRKTKKGKKKTKKAKRVTVYPQK